MSHGRRARRADDAPAPAHTHSHSHGDGSPAPVGRRPRRVLTALVLALLAATVAGLIILWPGASAPAAESEFLAPGVEIVPVTVTEVPEVGDTEESVLVEAVGRADPLDGQSVQVEVPPQIAADGIRTGDRLRVLDLGDQDAGGVEEASAPVLFYFDHERALPLGLLLLAYLLLVALVARGSGLRAMVGLAAGVAIVLWFMLPAIFAGQDPVLVALVAASAMIFPCVYFAHGISVRTTTAVLGTFGGIAVTVLIALLAGRATGMTGADGDAAQILFSSYPQLSLSAVFLAGVIISGLGALNDVTITQASSAWELRAAMPSASRLAVFSATMRIGRDHIASTVYTLAYAYIGSALPLLMYASTINRSLLDTLTSGEIAAEIFRTLVASIGLVLAIPLTTAIAAALAAPPAGGAGRSRRRQLEERPARS
ncbi:MULTISPECIES: YibE/F family protein [unclassified Brachybacterium]|uniref:YibE/F family protein n=1 Tax=unclassified Brachybacterium TaxID=2623841 RepID=UPI000C808E58|nr:YibE/F family protein [Brachybacterium sp. UMB0905]PMC76938.1 YibE/F family protein [Brachybacterium sp. UMB0905]